MTRPQFWFLMFVMATTILMMPIAYYQDVREGYERLGSVKAWPITSPS